MSFQQKFVIIEIIVFYFWNQYLKVTHMMLILTMDNIKHNPVLTIGDNIPNVPGEDFYVQHIPVVHR